MQSSQQILEELNKQYGQPGDAANLIESTIKDAYAPSVKNLIQEGNTLRGQYYPAFFNEAQRLGTGAADMSPAARLAAMQNAGESMGQLYRTNLGLRDYYNTDINNLVGRAQNQYNMGYGALKDQYTMALQGEQARQAAAAQAAATRAAQEQANYFNSLASNIGQGAGAGEQLDYGDVPSEIKWSDNQDYIKALVESGSGLTQVMYDQNGQPYAMMKLPDGRVVKILGADMIGRATGVQSIPGLTTGLQADLSNPKNTQWL